MVEVLESKSQFHRKTWIWIGAIALLWGMLDSTFFFIAPELLLTFLALSSLRRSLVAICLAIIGVALGGIFLTLWAAHFPEAARSTIGAIPGSDLHMIERATELLENKRVWIPVLSVFFGIPTKIYFAAAGVSNFGVGPILGLILPSVLVRYLIVTFIVYWLSSHILSKWPWAHKVVLFGVIWVIFYIAFFMGRVVTG